MFFKKKKPKQRAEYIDESNFQELVIGSKDVILLDFWAPWCAPCKVMGPIIDELAEDNKERAITIGKINVDDNPKLSAMFKIQSIPTIVFMKDGNVLQQAPGMVPKPDLQDVIDSLLKG